MLSFTSATSPRNTVCSNYLGSYDFIHDLHFQLLCEYFYLSGEVCSLASSLWSCITVAKRAGILDLLHAEKESSVKHVEWFWSVWQRKGRWMFWQYHLDGVRDRAWVFHSQNFIPAGSAYQAEHSFPWVYTQDCFQIVQPGKVLLSSIQSQQTSSCHFHSWEFGMPGNSPAVPQVNMSHRFPVTNLHTCCNM